MIVKYTSPLPDLILYTGLLRMTIKCRLARAGFELGSPDYQEKVLSTTLVRDHQFISGSSFMWLSAT